MIFDAHLDLAMNAMEWNRDLRSSIEEIRQTEQGMTDKPDRAKGTVCFPEMRRGDIGLCVATLIARHAPYPSNLPGWQSQEQAWAQIQGQFQWYKEMERQNLLSMIRDAASLKKHVDTWAEQSEQAGAEQSEQAGAQKDRSIGYVLSLEGADSIVSMEHLEQMAEQGLSAIGPVHYGPGVYGYGTDAEGPLGDRGLELLKNMEALHMILDLTHYCDQCFWEALDNFKGSVWASHNNCRSLVPHQRQFSDDQLKVLIERGAVIGVALDAWMLTPNWIRGESTPQNTGVSMMQVADQIDHICQLAGNANHVGIGSDLDGAFGLEQSPRDLNTIADLQKLEPILKDRGYDQESLDRILSKNFIQFLERHWKD